MSGPEEERFIKDIALHKVDDSVLGEKQMGIVVKELKPVVSKWPDLGFVLGIDYQVLENWKEKYGYKYLDGLRNMVDYYLHQNGQVKEPSWRAIVEAVSDDMGGCNHALAKEIAHNHPMLPQVAPKEETQGTHVDVNERQAPTDHQSRSGPFHSSRSDSRLLYSRTDHPQQHAHPQTVPMLPRENTGFYEQAPSGHYNEPVNLQTGHQQQYGPPYDQAGPQSLPYTEPSGGDKVQSLPPNFTPPPRPVITQRGISYPSNHPSSGGEQRCASRLPPFREQQPSHQTTQNPQSREQDYAPISHSQYVAGQQQSADARSGEPDPQGSYNYQGQTYDSQHLQSSMGYSRHRSDRFNSDPVHYNRSGRVESGHTQSDVSVDPLYAHEPHPRNQYTQRQQMPSRHKSYPQEQQRSHLHQGKSTHYESQQQREPRPQYQDSQQAMVTGQGESRYTQQQSSSQACHPDQRASQNVSAVASNAPTQQHGGYIYTQAPPHGVPPSAPQCPESLSEVQVHQAHYVGVNMSPSSQGPQDSTDSPEGTPRGSPVPQQYNPAHSSRRVYSVDQHQRSPVSNRHTPPPQCSTQTTLPVSGRRTPPPETQGQRTTNQSHSVSGRRTPPPETQGQRTTNQSHSVSGRRTPPPETQGQRTTNQSHSVSGRRTPPPETQGQRTTNQSHSVSGRRTPPLETQGQRMANQPRPLTQTGGPMKAKTSHGSSVSQPATTSGRGHSHTGVHTTKQSGGFGEQQSHTQALRGESGRSREQHYENLPSRDIRTTVPENQKRRSGEQQYVHIQDGRTASHTVNEGRWSGEHHYEGTQDSRTASHAVNEGRWSGEHHYEGTQDSRTASHAVNEGRWSGEHHYEGTQDSRTASHAVNEGRWSGEHHYENTRETHRHSEEKIQLNQVSQHQLPQGTDPYNEPTSTSPWVHQQSEISAESWQPPTQTQLPEPSKPPPNQATWQADPLSWSHDPGHSFGPNDSLNTESSYSSHSDPSTCTSLEGNVSLASNPNLSGNVSHKISIPDPKLPNKENPPDYYRNLTGEKPKEFGDITPSKYYQEKYVDTPSAESEGTLLTMDTLPSVSSEATTLSTYTSNFPTNEPLDASSYPTTRPSTISSQFSEEPPSSASHTDDDVTPVGDPPFPGPTGSSHDPSLEIAGLPQLSSTPVQREPRRQIGPMEAALPSSRPRSIQSSISNESSLSASSYESSEGESTPGLIVNPHQHPSMVSQSGSELSEQTVDRPRLHTTLEEVEEMEELSEEREHKYQESLSSVTTNPTGPKQCSSLRSSYSVSGDVQQRFEQLSVQCPSDVGGAGLHDKCTAGPPGLSIASGESLPPYNEIQPSVFSMSGPSDAAGSTHHQQEMAEEPQGELVLAFSSHVQRHSQSTIADGDVLPCETFEPFKLKPGKKCKIQLSFIKVEAVRGNRQLSEHHSVYPMNQRLHGLAIIINNEKFVNPHHKPREGTRIDEENLIVTFRYLGYDVEVYRDLSTKQMCGLFEEVKKRDHSQHDSFVCCILTHGKSGEIFGSDSSSIVIETLTEQLCAAKCSQLGRKPKIFFIQACRGDRKCQKVATDHADTSEGQTEEEVTEREMHDGPNVSSDSPVNILSRVIERSLSRDACRVELDSDIPDDADFFFGYATPSGRVAWRDMDTGSWYISELCRALCEYSLTLPLSDIILKVHKEVGEQYQYSNYKQAPEMTSRLTGKVFF